MSEWMRVMLEEIARKRAEQREAQAEERRRREERAAPAHTLSEGPENDPAEG